MFKLESSSQFETARGKVFIVESPVEAKRNFRSYLKALGDQVEINGKSYDVRGFEWHLPATPVFIGERIGILVEKV